MHINPKRMKKRIDKAQGIQAEPGAIIDPIEYPEYLKATDSRERAAILGLHITEMADGETGATIYIMAGGCLYDLDEPAREYDSAAAVEAEINNLWDIMTEPEIAVYADSAGRLHERTEYPELNYK